MKDAIVLCRGAYRELRAKTAHGLIRYGKRFRIVAVIDESCKGLDAGEVIGMGNIGIPIVDNIDRKADAMIIGVAPTGGRLPPKWREDIKTAIEMGMDIVSGLHDFISEDDEFKKLAEKHGVNIWDVRKPPCTLPIATGKKPDVPIILVAGTDCAVGKRTTTLELIKSAERTGMNPGYVATGQTGMMIGCDAGVAVDRIPGDFISGIVEKMLFEAVDKGKNILFVEGQGSMTHIAYAPVTLGLLLGAHPDFIVIAHDPHRKFRPSFPRERVPEPDEEYEYISRYSDAKWIGISLNCKLDESEELCNFYEKKMGITTVNVFKHGGNRIVERILEELK